MGKNSKIEWCNHTWNPWYGCHKVSAGCKNCYMYRDMSRRSSFDPNVVTRAKSATFYQPLKWKDPARVFTCSWSDFFIEEADPWRAEALEIIASTPHLTYQILTKRIERVLDWLDTACWPASGCPIETLPHNVWLGVSAENQKTYDQRIPYLLEIPATVRFVSLEPLLGPIDLTDIMSGGETLHGAHEDDVSHWCAWCGGLVDYTRQPAHDCYNPKLGIDWVITGGESGPYSRQAALDWFRSIRDQCQSLKIPFFHKQHGGNSKIDGSWGGRMLDGRTWDEMPRRV